MTHASRDFVVYPCAACGKRIFTNPELVGRTGQCPLCGEEHTVGGPLVAEPGQERRGAERVKPRQSRVELRRHKSQAAHKNDAVAQELYPLEDLSETGLGFLMPGRRDTRRLSRQAPPPIAVGDKVQVTIHFGGLARPRAYEATVRRVVAPSYEGRPFLVGAEFEGLTPAQREQLRRLVGRHHGQDPG
jgi:hypothetical protein